MKHAAPFNASRAALHLVAGGLACGIAGEARLAMEVPVDLTRPGFSCASISVSLLRPSVIAMSQKSSVMKTYQFVPEVLMSAKMTRLTASDSDTEHHEAMS